eukprot:11267562-Karenia_brevis.AAC.1
MEIKKLHVQGLVYGKYSSNTAVEDTRIIVPQGALLQLADTPFSRAINGQINQIINPHPSTFVGGRKFTQTLDIAWSIGMVIEKGLDSFSQAAVVQEDVATYFDTLP